MPKPQCIQWDLGTNVHGQTIRLVRIEQSGPVTWKLEQRAANQRDGEQSIDMSDTQLAAIVEIIQEHP